jgi:hypothetical protein
MRDDKSKSDNEEAQRIDIQTDDDLKKWSEYFGVTEDNLRVAVWRVGLDAADIQKELIRNQGRHR